MYIAFNEIKGFLESIAYGNDLTHAEMKIIVEQILASGCSVRGWVDFDWLRFKMLGVMDPSATHFRKRQIAVSLLKKMQLVQAEEF